MVPPRKFNSRGHQIITALTKECNRAANNALPTNTVSTVASCWNSRLPGRTAARSQHIIGSQTTVARSWNKAIPDQTATRQLVLQAYPALDRYKQSATHAATHCLLAITRTIRNTNKTTQLANNLAKIRQRGWNNKKQSKASKNSTIRCVEDTDQSINRALPDANVSVSIN